MNPSVAARRSQASQPGRMSPSTTICRGSGAFAVGLSLAFLLLDPALLLEAAFQFTNMPSLLGHHGKLIHPRGLPSAIASRRICFAASPLTVRGSNVTPRLASRMALKTNRPLV